MSTGRFPEEFWVEKESVKGFDVAFVGIACFGALPPETGAIEKA